MMSFSEPDPHEFDEPPTEAEQIASHIDALMQFAATPDEWLKICQLCKTIGDEPPIKTWHSFAWHATRPDWDLGDLVGSGSTELAAIADLLEQEDDA